MTEKDYNPKQKESKAMKKQDAPAKKEIPQEPAAKKEAVAKIPGESIKKAGTEKVDVKKEAEKKKLEEIKKNSKPKTKKEIVKVNIQGAHVSAKYSVAICKFIKNKTIDHAIKDLEQVALKKLAVPMKGEIPHRKGRMMSGRFPVRASASFIMALKSLKSNAEYHDIENPVICEAVSNIGSRPLGRFGRHQRKRTHLTIAAKTLKKKKAKEIKKLPKKEINKEDKQSK